MKARIVIPTKVLVEWDDVQEVLARGREGSMGILPRRLDFASPLVPGIVEVRRRDAGPEYAAVDGGVLVKTGGEVSIAAARAIHGKDLPSLRQTVKEEFEVLGEEEKEARVALASLEARFVRRFVEERRRARR